MIHIYTGNLCTYTVIVKYFALAFEHFLAPCFTELLMVLLQNALNVLCK